MAPRKARVLLADDDPALRELTAEVLTDEGFEVTAAPGGTAALALLREGSFDALVTDILMPDMTGIELLRATRLRDLDIPVVLMTGSPETKSAAAAVNEGALRYLVKPVPHDDLLEAVSEAVRLGKLARVKRELLQYTGQAERLIGDRAGLTTAFQGALESLWMAFQPIYDAAGRVWGSEALMRSRSGALGSPVAVLDAAERLDRLPELGRRVRDHVASIFSLRGHPGPVSVNLHPADLDDAHLYSPSALLSEHAGEVVLELTERAPLQDITTVRERVRRLKELGFRIAIDDLGAGYAGLSSFVALEPHIVKLDLSLVRDVHKEPLKHRLVQSVVQACRDSGMLVVAEGIENEGERDALARLGCDLMQGFALGRPAPPRGVSASPPG